MTVNVLSTTDKPLNDGRPWRPNDVWPSGVGYGLGVALAARNYIISFRPAMQPTWNARIGATPGHDVHATRPTDRSTHRVCPEVGIRDIHRSARSEYSTCRTVLMAPVAGRPNDPINVFLTNRYIRMDVGCSVHCTYLLLPGR
jgi:hypothetical protein